MQGTQHDQAAPVDQFYLFDRDHLKFITPVQSRWGGQAVNAADIVNLAENSEDQEKIDLVNQRTVPQDGSMQLRFECIPSLLKNATFHRSQVYLDGQTLLSGAAGKRARSQFSLNNKESRNELAAALSCNSATNLSASPEWVSEPAPSVPICLDCRNLTNYYHFVSETLTALSVVAPLAHGRRINIHTGNTKTAKDGFAYRFLLAAFPELVDQIYFVNDLDPVSYDECIYPFSTDHMFYILNREAWSETETRSLSEDLKNMCEATDKERNIFRFLSFDGSLTKLREKCFSLTDNQADRPLTKVLVSRREQGARVRSGENWALLRDNLLSAGFEEVFFEDMSPLQQVETMQNASVVVAAHGAGMTNMLFCGSNAHVIEVGNIETTGGRLAVFHQIAQVSGCKYTVALVDRGVAQIHPNGQRVLAPISPSRHAVDKIVNLALG